MGTLALTRRAHERIVIDGDIYVEIVDILPGGKVRLGIDAPDSVQVDREEIHDQKVAEGRVKRVDRSKRA
jgi:carbon storage regulator